MAIDISRAEKISGWMISSELEWLAEQASKHKKIVEIGCWLGRSTRALADNTPGTVWAVDTFYGSEEHQEELAKHPPDWLISGFRENMKDLGNVYMVPMISLRAAEFFSPDQFDMIFLDARHDYASVKQDILAWMPLLSPGGLLCGHDLGPNWPEVETAVRELIPDFKVAVNQIWYKP